MTQAYNLSQLANKVNTSGQLDASTGLYNTNSIGFPSGTRMSFNQTSAPTGWTKDTSSAIDDSLLRLVTGSVGSGGSSAFSVWNASGVTGATTLSTTEIPSHTHQQQRYTGGTAGGGSAYSNSIGAPVNSPQSGNCPPTLGTGGGGSHTHSLANNLKYYDFIIAQKD